jgi:hypothetical protein
MGKRSKPVEMHIVNHASEKGFRTSIPSLPVFLAPNRTGKLR